MTAFVNWKLLTIGFACLILIISETNTHTHILRGDSMKKILTELIALDQKAKAITRPVENELANLDNIIKQKAAEILVEIDKNIAVKIAQIREDSLAYIVSKKAEIDNETGAIIAKIEAEWEQNSLNWQSEIVMKL